MWNILAALPRRLTIAIPAAMVLGLILGLYCDCRFLKHTIVPITFLMIYPMMVTLKVRKVLEGGDVKAQVICQFINFGIIPFIAYGLGLLFFPDKPYMALGLLLAGLIPTSGMTISWTGLARGNLEAAVKMTVIGLTLGALLTPFYVQFLLGEKININILQVMKQIGLFVFLPLVAGFVTQQVLIKRYGQNRFQTSIAPKFPPISTLGVLGIVFIAMALKSKAITGSPQLLLFILAPVILGYVATFLLSSMVGRLLLTRNDAVALVFGTVMRNLSIAMAVAINAFGEEGSAAALVISIAYVVQVQSAAWFVKLTDKVFGRDQ
jgi:ACR3 family arsenite efflux pump ArsB